MYDRPIEVRLDKTLGYEYFMDKTHPLANKQGRVYLHRHVASIEEGRWLTVGEVVHHRDGNRSNNFPENLVILASRAEHNREHGEETVPHPCEECGDPTTNNKYCSQKCAAKASRVVDRPTKSQLRQDIESMSWTAVGRKYGVSDNAVRKWARTYGLL